MTQYERATYSILEWLGDIGGLFDGLRALAGAFFQPLALFAMKSDLLTKVYRKASKIEPGVRDSRLFLYSGRMNKRMLARFYGVFSAIG